jgi:hypothetical protein
VYPNLPRVERLPPTHEVPADNSAYPILRIFPGDGSNLDAISHGVGLAAYYDNFHVNIFGMVAPSTDGVNDTPADTWRHRLRQDVVEMLHQHFTLGGVAETILFAGPKLLEDVDLGRVAPKAYFVLPINVLLKESYSLAP